MSAHPSIQILCGDSRKVLARFNEQADLIMTSPPYADARKTHYQSVKPNAYVEWFTSFHLVFWNTLKPNGSLIINIKDKVVQGTRHRYVWQTIERLASLGWNCIDDFIWVKKNSMPGYWPNRLKDGWEYCFHLAKSKQPYLNHAAVGVPLAPASIKRYARFVKDGEGRHYSATGSGFNVNRKRCAQGAYALPSNVLTSAAVSYNTGHPAAYPLALPDFFIKLLTPVDGLVIDPFAGSGTTGLAALALGRRAILVDNKLEYCQLARQRLDKLVTKGMSKRTD